MPNKPELNFVIDRKPAWQAMNLVPTKDEFGRNTYKLDTFDERFVYTKRFTNNPTATLIENNY